MNKIEVTYLSGSVEVYEVPRSIAFAALNNFRARWGVQSARIM